MMQTDISTLTFSEYSFIRTFNHHMVSLFLEAASSGKIHLVKTLLARKAATQTMLNDALSLAAEHGHTRTAQAILNAGADIHSPDSYRKPDRALRWASYGGHTQTVRMLLRYNADVHACDIFGNPDGACSIAARNLHWETVRVLLHAKASVDCFPSYLMITHFRLSIDCDDVSNIGRCLRMGSRVLRRLTFRKEAPFDIVKFNVARSYCVNTMLTATGCCRDLCELAFCYT